MAFYPGNRRQENLAIPSGRLALLKRVLIFQLKLIADGLRDLVLAPLSLIAAVLGILRTSGPPEEYFERLLITGRRTERWIDLFGQYGQTGARATRERTFDDLIDGLEQAVKSHPKGNAAAQKLKDKLETILDRVPGS